MSIMPIVSHETRRFFVDRYPDMHRIVDRFTREKTAPFRFGTNIALNDVKFLSPFSSVEQDISIARIHVLVQPSQGSLEQVAIPLEMEDFEFSPPNAPRAKRIEWTRPHYFKTLVRGHPVTIEYRLFGQLIIQTNHLVVQCEARAERNQGEFAYVVPVGFELYIK